MSWIVQGADWHGDGVLFVMLGSVGLLEWGISVVVFSVGGGPWGGPFRGRLLEIDLSKVVVLRCRR